MAKTCDLTQKQLLNAEERLRLLMKNIRDHAIFVLDRNGDIIDWNAGAESVLGYKENEILGKNISQIFTSEDRQTGDPEQELKKAATEGRAEDERWHIKKDGTRFWALGVLESLKNDEGVVCGYAKILRDFTQRKESEAALIARSEELARSNRELQEFTHIASHDLKSPLKTVHNYLGLIQEKIKENPDEEMATSVSRALEGNERMQRLIDDLLNYARVGIENPTFVPVDCSVVTKIARRNLTHEIRKNLADITTGYLPLVNGNENLLTMLFQNLIENAIKYHGKNPPKLHIEARQSHNEWIIAVVDNGIGIDRAYWGVIFETFRRLHSHSQYPGTGIGLAICQKIVERHGGRIWVESQPGKGSMFFFTLPKMISNQ